MARDPVDGYQPQPRNPAEDRPPAPVGGLARFDAELAEIGGARSDGFANAFTGIGDPNRDKALGGPGGLAFNFKLLTGTECEDRWRGSDLGSRIIETVPDEMLREGWELQVQPTKDDKPNELITEDDAGQAVIDEVATLLRKLGTVPALRDALCYERAYGGGAVLLGVDDGVKDLTIPLDLDRVKSIKHLTAFRGGWDGELVAWRYYNDPRQARFGEPEVYLLRNLGVPLSSLPVPGAAVPARVSMEALQFFVHESRLLVFPGVAVSRSARVQMRGWGDSLFTRVDEVLGQYGQAWGGLANLMTDWAQGVLKIDGLAEILASDDPSSSGLVAKRMTGIQMSRSIARMVLLDKNEEFSREVTSLAGVADVAQQFALRLAAAADMPVSLLMGQAPAGLNATGASDVRFFYDRIASKQRDKLLPRLHRLLQIVFRAQDGPTEGVEPDRWEVEMRSLWQPTAAEESQQRFQTAQTDQIYLANSVVTAEEIAASRFGGSKYSTETTLDFEARKKMAELDKNAPGGPTSPTSASTTIAPGSVPKPIAPAPGSPAPGGGGNPNQPPGRAPAAVARAPAPARGDATDQPREPAGSPHGGEFAANPVMAATNQHGVKTSAGRSAVAGVTSKGTEYLAINKSTAQAILDPKKSNYSVRNHLWRHQDLSREEHAEVSRAYAHLSSTEQDPEIKSAYGTLSAVHADIHEGVRSMPTPRPTTSPKPEPPTAAKPEPPSVVAPPPVAPVHATMPQLKEPLSKARDGRSKGATIERNAAALAAHSTSIAKAVNPGANGTTNVSVRRLGAGTAGQYASYRDSPRAVLMLSHETAGLMGEAIRQDRLTTGYHVAALKTYVHESMHAASQPGTLTDYEGPPSQGKRDYRPSAHLQEAITETLAQHHIVGVADGMGLRIEGELRTRFSSPLFMHSVGATSGSIMLMRPTSYQKSVVHFAAVAMHSEGLDEKASPQELHDTAVKVSAALKTQPSSLDRYRALASPIAERLATAAGMSTTSPEYSDARGAVTAALKSFMCREHLTGTPVKISDVADMTSQAFHASVEYHRGRSRT